MSKKNVFVAVVLTVCVIAAAGALLASNMGFKLNYPLLAQASGVSLTGKNTIALPYFRQTGIDNALNLINDISGGAPNVGAVANVQRLNRIDNSISTYTGRMGSPVLTPFPLVAGEGYFVVMLSNVNYIVVGAHDPALAYTLQAQSPGVSLTGKNFYAPPYNITATNALQLINDISGGAPNVGAVANVQRLNRVDNTIATYTGRMGSPVLTPFPLVPGEAYTVVMLTTVPYIASHY
jgi:hypothetical protein